MKNALTQQGKARLAIYHAFDQRHSGRMARNLSVVDGARETCLHSSFVRCHPMRKTLLTDRLRGRRSASCPIAPRRACAAPGENPGAGTLFPDRDGPGSMSPGPCVRSRRSFSIPASSATSATPVEITRAITMPGQMPEVMILNSPSLLTNRCGCKIGRPNPGWRSKPGSRPWRLSPGQRPAG